VCRFLAAWVDRSKMVANWEARIENARERREKQLRDEYRIPADKLPGDDVKDVSRFPYESGLMSSKELEITDARVRDILTKITNKQWKAEDVAKSFCKRAVHAHQLVNCLTEMMFEQAIDRAKELDEYYEREGKLYGPLHGLPISIKDQHNIKGAATSVGYSKWSQDISSYDSALVSMLRDLGAVIYCKTAGPLANMSTETETRLWGLTTNPKNRDLGVGGSSGGEGALLNFGGSPVGMGSDIGGSVRFPCAFNGLYGLRTSANRMPIAGTRSGLAGQAHIKAVIGPMTRDVDSLEYITRVVFNSNPTAYDFDCMPIPWREPQLAQKLSFGVMQYDGICRVTPPVQRALDMTVQALRNAGHEVIEWEGINVPEMVKCVSAFFISDGGKFLQENLDDEPLPESMELLAAKVTDIPSSKVWEFQRIRAEIEKKTIQQWKDSRNETSTGRQIDGLISPVSFLPSHPHHGPTHMGYTAYWNAMDWPCVSFPVTAVDQELDQTPADFAPISNQEKELWDTYQVSQCKDGFVGLQLTCPKYQDERAIALAKTISSVLDK
jgi:amidase